MTVFPMRTLSLVLAAALLAGCNPPYRPPAADTTARVRFTYDTSTRPSVSYYALNDGKCSGARKIRQFNSPLVGSTSKKDADLGMAKDPDQKYFTSQYHEITVVANQRFHLASYGVAGGYSCAITGSFVPAAEEQYEIVYRMEAEQCTLRVDRIWQSGERLVRQHEPSSLQNDVTCEFFWN